MAKYTDQQLLSSVGVSQALRVLGLLDVLDEEGQENTPRRIAKAWSELTNGVGTDPREFLRKTFDVEHKELVLCKDIAFVSMCEHHFMPFIGVAHVAYIPNDKVTGLSKLARVVDGYAHRPQVQERLTTQIVEALQDVLNPQGAAVILKATHTCMSCRGASKPGSITVTSAVRGVFETEPSARAELLSLINER